MRKVCCVQTKTLKFPPNVQLYKVTYGPKYRPPRPLATGTKNPQKNLEIRFSYKMAAKTTSSSGFRPYSCSPPDLVYLAKNRKNFSGALFRDIWGQSRNIQRIFFKVTKLSHSLFFDILWPLCPSATVPKFIHFHRVINFLGKCAFLDLADFWLIFRFFERIKVCAFISRKLNKLRRPFFTFPNNFTLSTLI